MRNNNPPKKIVVYESFEEKHCPFVLEDMSLRIFTSYCYVAPVRGSLQKYMGFVVHNHNSICVATMELNCLCLIFSAFSFSVSALTTDEVSKIRTKLERKVLRGSNVPTALRLSFHDCVGGFSKVFDLFVDF